MSVVMYDSVDVKENILLDLPFREATGVVTQDVAKLHHPMVMVNTPTWAQEGTLSVVQLNGTSEYLLSLAADTADLNFIAGDYSLGGWLRWETGEDSQIVMGRYIVSVSGWELYLYFTGLLTLRHHHAAGASTRTGCYSDGWVADTWHHFGVSRSGAAAIHYRNGVALTTTHTAGGLINPETNNSNLVIGVRTTLDTNYFSGKLWRPRIYNEALTAADWLAIYEREVGWF